MYGDLEMILCNSIPENTEHSDGDIIIVHPKSFGVVAHSKASQLHEFKYNKQTIISGDVMIAPKYLTHWQHNA